MKRFDFRRTGKKTLILCAMALAIAVIAGCGYTTHSTVENAPTNSSSPVVTCSANPSSVVSGSSSQIVTKAVSPEGLPLTYTYSATEGSLQSQGQSATLATQGITGNVIVTCQAVDSKGNFYISDGGSSQQVKVFTPDGKPLRETVDRAAGY